MTVEFFLQRLDGVRRSGRGWMAKCPAHADRSPSLSVSEAEDGKILVHCFAGCSIEPICETIGIEVAQLFYDSDLTLSQRQALPPLPKRFDWRQFANAVQHLSDTFFLRGERIFHTAQGLNPSEWGEADLDQAMAVIAKAQYFREQSECLADLAVAYRAKHLTEEQSNAHRRSKVA